MLRKLMRMPGQPGIVYVHYWAGLMMRRFIDTAEDAIDIVLKVLDGYTCASISQLSQACKCCFWSCLLCMHHLRGSTLNCRAQDGPINSHATVL